MDHIRFYFGCRWPGFAMSTNAEFFTALGCDHSEDIIKPSNILLHANGQAKLRFFFGSLRATKVVGTPNYMAPEAA